MTITKKNYKAFQDDLRTPLLLSVNETLKVGELSVSQKQAVTKLIEKRTKINDLLKTGD